MSELAYHLGIIAIATVVVWLAYLLLIYIIACVIESDARRGGGTR